MKLKNYINTLTIDELKSFAVKAETSTAYIKQLASGHRKAGVKSIINIPIASNGKVSAADLRPDVDFNVSESVN